jgi:hypothetical protein
MSNSSRAQPAPGDEPAAVPGAGEEREGVLDRVLAVPLLHLGKDSGATPAEDAGRAVEDPLFVALDIALDERHPALAFQ